MVTSGLKPSIDTLLVMVVQDSYRKHKSFSNITFTKSLLSFFSLERPLMFHDRMLSSSPSYPYSRTGRPFTYRVS